MGFNAEIVGFQCRGQSTLFQLRLSRRLRHRRQLPVLGTIGAQNVGEVASGARLNELARVCTG